VAQVDSGVDLVLDRQGLYANSAESTVIIAWAGQILAAGRQQAFLRSTV